jgi:predicted phage terminase large subunit-like protein
MTERSFFQAILRTDFSAFIQKAFETVAPGEAYIHNWHVEAVAFALTRCHLGFDRRLVITQPPRSLKSIAASVALPAWALGHNPTRRFICVSYSQDLALELARQFRLIVESNWYRALFPATRWKRDSGAECVTTLGGSRLATSIGGTLTGRGADVIVIDDPMKAEDAQSELARKRVLDWYQGTLISRLNDKRTGVIILAMQRLHQEDLAGYVLNNGDWRHLDLPAKAWRKQRIEIAPGVFHDRKIGDLLQPEREPKAVLERIKAALGELRYSAQYQQQPNPVEGNLLKREWLQTYKALPEGYAHVLQSWDTASSLSETADYSACVTAALRGGRFFIIDVWRGRLQYPDLKRKVAEQSQRFKAENVFIERAGPGEALVQDYLRCFPGSGKVLGVRPDANKSVRFEAASAAFERGDVLLPKAAPWLDAFVAELLAFPYGRHDDQADALAQLLRVPPHRYGRSICPVGIEILTCEDDRW